MNERMYRLSYRHVEKHDFDADFELNDREGTLCT